MDLIFYIQLNKHFKAMEMGFLWLQYYNMVQIVEFRCRRYFLQCNDGLIMIL